MELEEIRKNIDDIDNQIISLLSKRSSFVKEVAEYKQRHNKDIFDGERIEQILKERGETAKELGLEPGLIKPLFEKIVEDSMKLQKKLIEKSKDGIKH